MSIRAIGCPCPIDTAHSTSAPYAVVEHERWAELFGSRAFCCRGCGYVWAAPEVAPPSDADVFTSPLVEAMPQSAAYALALLRQGRSGWDGGVW